MANLKNVIYLSNEDYETLVSTGTVTIDGETLTYDENNVYVTPDKLASSTEDGLMSATDKSKLDNIESGAEANIQADWNQTNISADDYIKNKPSIPSAQVNSDWNATSGVAQILNKPTIPTVNNATLTIQKNGTTVNTFTANASSNVTVNITVPTTLDDISDGSSRKLANYLPLSGGSVTGDLKLYVASGDSPRLIFQRGTLIDTYNDWSLYDSSGYLYIQQRGSGSTNWETRATFDQSGVNFAGTISENGTTLANKYQAKDADLTAIAGLGDSSTGFLRKTAANTWSLATPTDTNYYATSDFTSSNGTKIATGYSSGTASTTYDLYVPNATSSQAGVVTTGSQTFAGDKTFNGAVTINNSFVSTAGSTSISNYLYTSGGVWLSGGSVYSAADFRPSGSVSLGTKSEKWTNLFLSGTIRDGKNNNYGLALPDTTNYSVNKTIATTSDIPANQNNTIIVGNALTNISGKSLSAYTSQETTVGGYPVIKILKDGSILSETDAASYMAAQSGSSYVPKYDYDNPSFSYFIFSDGTLYKPQWDATNGLLLYKMNKLAFDGNVVHKTGNENIDGQKIFTDLRVLSSGSAPLIISDTKISRGQGIANFDLQLGDSGKIYGTSSTYGLSLPSNMSQWTANKTIATTDDIPDDSNLVHKDGDTMTGSLSLNIGSGYSSSPNLTFVTSNGAGSFYKSDETLIFTHTGVHSYTLTFPMNSGTVALTSNIPPRIQILDYRS